jgi:aspartyl-tRNA(Asn)/glutamyl-tRNA(Gln) amidotransferase subunit A
MLAVMSQYDPKDSTMAELPLINDVKLPPYKFCYFREMLDHPSLDQEISAAIRLKIEVLRNEGHSVSELTFDLLEYVVPAYYVLTTAEASSNLSRYDGIRYGYQSPVSTEDLFDFYCSNRSAGFGTEVKRRIMLGSFVLSAGFYDAYYKKAQKVRRLLKEQLSQIFSDYDAILSPVSPAVAFKTGEKVKDPTQIYLADIYTVLANLTGCAGISLPLFSHSNGMPFGLQVLANNGDEVPLLRISKMLMSSK